MFMSRLGRMRGKGRVPTTRKHRGRELSPSMGPITDTMIPARTVTTARAVSMPSIPYAEPVYATEARPFRPTPELRVVTDKPRAPVRKRPSLWETFFPAKKAAPIAVEARKIAITAPITGPRRPTQITVDVIKGTKKLITYTFYGETESEARALERKQAVMDPLFRGATQQGRYGSSALGVKRTSKRTGWWS